MLYITAKAANAWTLSEVEMKYFFKTKKAKVWPARLTLALRSQLASSSTVLCSSANGNNNTNYTEDKATAQGGSVPVQLVRQGVWADNNYDQVIYSVSPGNYDRPDPTEHE